MRLVINRCQLVQVQMSVPLRRRETRVAQKFLNHPQIGAAIEQMSGKTVAQPVRPHLDWDAGLLQMLLNDARDAPRGNPLAPVIEENSDLTFTG